MPRSAHRRCKEQGPTCLGITHPGFDICSRCLYDVVRPRMRKEKEAVRARQRARHQLSESNRTLINAVDLDEPHLRPEPVSLAAFIDDLRIERKAHDLLEKHDGDYLAAIHDAKMRQVLDIPVTVDRAPSKSLQEDPEPMPELAAPTEPAKRRSGRYGRASKLNDAQWLDIVNAYQSGLSVSEICGAWDIGTGSLYQRLKRLNIPTRKSQEPKEEVDATPKTSPTVSHQVAEPAPSNGVVSGLTEWTVEFEFRTRGRETVHAASFNDAATAVIASHREEMQIEVISVAKVNH